MIGGGFGGGVGEGVGWGFGVGEGIGGGVGCPVVSLTYGRYVVVPPPACGDEDSLIPVTGSSVVPEKFIVAWV